MRGRLRASTQVNESAVQLLRDQGFHVDTEKGSLGEDELIERLREGKYTALGIRSKTNVTKKVIDSAPSVRAIALTCQLMLRRASTAHLRRLLLYRYKSSRPGGMRESGHLRFQLTLRKVRSPTHLASSH